MEQVLRLGMGLNGEIVREFSFSMNIAVKAVLLYIIWIGMRC